jgi:hypothetical protein
VQIGAYQPIIPASTAPPAGGGSPDKEGVVSTQKSEQATQNGSSESKQSENSQNDTKNSQQLSPEEKQLVSQLQARDTEVRAHEMAHLAAAGGIATGGASYSYQRGPDGKMYAVGGEVPIAVSKGKTPEETVQKMRQVAAAAMAPADPSPQDYSVAANARAEEMKALQEMRKEQMEMLKNEGMKTYQKAAEGENMPGGDAQARVTA